MYGTYQKYGVYRLYMGLYAIYGAYRLYTAPVSNVSLCKNEGRLRHRTMKVCGRCEVIAPNILNIDAE